MNDTRLQGTVRIVGAGLLGTSIGLGLRARGVDVILDDRSQSNLRLAIDYGAGRAAAAGDAPRLIVVAVPPEQTAAVVAQELADYTEALVTDVASVKVVPLQELKAMGADLSRYLGSHPMAGRERGGPISARADLFEGRPWVLAGHPDISYRAAGPIEDMILDLGGVPIEMDAAEHDEAVAYVSHMPQLLSSLTAARLAEAHDVSLALAGQGVRDVTRVAASSPELWLQILAANRAPVLDILRRLQLDLSNLVRALDNLEAPGAMKTIADVISRGNTGVQRLPGKHGQRQGFAVVVVLIDDTPGQLAKLLTEVGELGVNLEDLRLEHSPGAPIGIAELSVVPEVAEQLIDDLSERGWRISAQ